MRPLVLGKKKLPLAPHDKAPKEQTPGAERQGRQPAWAPPRGEPRNRLARHQAKLPDDGQLWCTRAQSIKGQGYTETAIKAPFGAHPRNPMESKHNEYTRIIQAKNPTNCERGAYIKEQEREAPLCPPRLSDYVYLRTSKQLRQVPQPTNTHAICSLCWSPAQLRGRTLPCWTAALVCRVSLPSCAYDGPREL